MIVQGCADASSSEADGVGPSCWIMDGRAGGLGHGPLVPNLLSVVATPETNSDVITLGHRNGLLSEGRAITMRKCREQNKQKKKDGKQEWLFKGQ